MKPELPPLPQHINEWYDEIDKCHVRMFAEQQMLAIRDAAFTAGVEAGRAECAKLCDDKANEWGFYGRPKYALEDAASAIRALPPAPVKEAE